MPGEFHGQRSLAGYSPWGHKNRTRLTDKHFHFSYNYVRTHDEAQSNNDEISLNTKFLVLKMAKTKKKKSKMAALIGPKIVDFMFENA